MQEMVEPDRTILIVSIIGLVVIWGSVAYHRWVQDGREAPPEMAAAGLPGAGDTGGAQGAAATAGDSEAGDNSSQGTGPSSGQQDNAGKQAPRGRGKGKKSRKR